MTFAQADENSYTVRIYTIAVSYRKERGKHVEDY